MAANCLTPEAQRENAMALASALGVSHGEAAEALDLRILITSNPEDLTGQQISKEIVELLSRTVQRTLTQQSGEDVAAEIIIGSATSRTVGRTIYLDVLDDRMVISQSARHGRTCTPIPGILRLLVACYASAVALNCALGNALLGEQSDPFVLKYDQLGIDWTSVSKPIELGRTFLAGAGAIGNGFLWAARHLNFRGQLDIVDDDAVSSGNLNRQIWFNRNDIGLPKVHQLAKKAEGHFQYLTLVPRQCRLQDLPEKSAGAWLRRLIVAVDSPRARRELQNEFPREVFDASTTDIREVIIHYNVQPTTKACLSCIYERDDKEISREQHIADHLGVSLEDVRSSRISACAAQSIAAKFPELAACDLIGVAYDTLFKNLCAEGQLHTMADKTIFAPFSFVSVLAGTLLALEIVRRLGTGNDFQDFNYWRVSPWYPLQSRKQINRQRQPGCEFCGNDLLRKVSKDLWS